MDYSAFKKLLAFFSALKDSGFRRTLKEISNFTLIRGARTPVDKEFAMKMLHAFPEFQSDQFKDDNAIIRYLSDPRNRERILSRFTPKLRGELETTLNEKAGRAGVQIITEGQNISVQEETPQESGAASSAGGGMPSMPSASVPAIHPIFRTKPPVTETPKPDIVIANSSGHAAEAGDPSKLVKTTSTGQIKEAGEPSKLVTADRTGGIKETGRPSQFVTPESAARGDASKLVSSSGRPLKESVHSGTGKSVPSGRRFNTSFFRSSAGNAFKGLQRFASPANPFLKTNLNRIGEGFKSMFGNLGNAGGRALMGGLNLGGNTAGRLSNLRGSLKGKLRGAGSRTSSAVKGGGKKFALASVFGFLLFFLIAMSGNMTGTTPIGDAAPPAPVPGPITPPGPKPPPPAPDPDTDKLKQNIISTFGITMNGFDKDQLTWAWEKLWDVSNTKFINFVRGSTVQAVAAGESEQIGCPGGSTAIRLGRYTNPELFKLILIHEFGHVIRNCPNTQNNYYAAHDNAYDKEGGITYYARYAAKCSGSDNKSEDYAEMIAYYLNPTTDIQTHSCSTETSNPNMSVKYPLHYATVKNILGDY